jgi:hypothetical protein
MGSGCSTSGFVLFPDDDIRETKSIVTNDGQIRVYARGSSRRNSDVDNKTKERRKSSFTLQAS